jgi:hypothetical protein
MLTYGSRSMVEIILAIALVGFLIGFISVLCIGNYYRAKRAMERQKMRRLARLSNGSAPSEVSPSSVGSSGTGSDERQHLLPRGNGQPDLPQRRRNFDQQHDLLLFDEHERRQQPQPQITRV